ncbi:MAG: hypothetical protein LGR52_11050 [Candidatus Thiosymbion ectosymbiont of Robbea hypermnestra]|nr:hypothetical protein [Candidatus Thiosymbion ectosymbiont of Robbea hypermnestra]
MGRFSDPNASKASFNTLYDAPTPKPYLEQMILLNYCIADEVVPFVVAAIDFLNSSGKNRVSILDVGSSYGISAGMIKYDPISPEYLIWSQREKLCAGLFIAAPVAGFRQFHAHMAAVATKKEERR